MTSKRKDVRIHRAKADVIVDGIKERIVEVNNNPGFCYRITEALIFGSYANDPDKEMLGDVDVAVRLEPKYELHSPEMESKRDECRSSDFLAVANWPMEEVLRYIRHRNGYVSMHRLGRSQEQDELILSDEVIHLDVGL